MTSDAPPPSPRFARLTILALAVAWCVGLAVVALDTPPPRRTTPSDLDLHAAVVERMRSGEAYYDALETELRSRGYPTQSVFNWRLPMPLAAIARAPAPLWARHTLAALAAALLAWASILLLRDVGPAGALTGSLALAGAVLPCFVDRAFYSHLLWAGVLIGLSLCSEAAGRRLPAVLFGVAAVFCRELALGYCLVALAVHLYQGRRRAAVGWLIGIGLFGVHLGWHVATVRARLDAAALPTLDTQYWWNLKGLPFLVSTAKMNGALLGLPAVVAYAYLTAALAGLFGPVLQPVWRRLAAGTVAGYLVAFLFVGREVNAYWGTLITVPLAFGLAGLPESLARLKNSLQSPRPPDRYD